MEEEIQKAIDLLELVARAREPRLLHGEVRFSFSNGRIANWEFRDTHRRNDLDSELENRNFKIKQ